MASSSASPMLAGWSAKATKRQATRRAELSISDPVSSTFIHTDLLPEQEEALRDRDIPNRTDGTWPRKSMHTPHIRSGSNPVEDFDIENRLSLGPSTIMNSLSSMPSRASLSQGKPSGFRATIKRMFGSKRRRPSINTVHSRYHPSDPGNLMSIMDSHTILQGLSQPERPVTRSDALYSHGIPVAASARNRSIATTDREHVVSTYKRRNTLPSLAFSELEAQTFSRSLTEQRTKPELDPKTQERCQALYDDRRRSRSADALNRLYNSTDTASVDRQDRSSAITYWRNSVMMNPLPKLSDPAENPATKATSHRTSQRELSVTRPQIQPAQSFDFGLNVENEPIDLEERVNTLEVKMYDFEYAIAKLQGVQLSKPALPLKVIKQKSTSELFPPSSNRSRSTSRSVSRSASRSVSRSTLSSHPEMAFLASPCPSPIPTTEVEAAYRHDRASKTLTIRPSTSRRPPSRSNAPSPASIKAGHDQFDILMSIIQDEKAARQQMEMQLMELQKEVELLQAPIYATIRPIDHLNSDSHANSPTTHRAKRLHRSPPFEFIKVPAPDVSRFSMTESDAESEGFQESFETPQENRYVFESNRGSPLVPVK